ncbi:hypothetical protein TNCV_2383651 [Trichonephila clavipes]|nr:hypothetical protein TNCV_2383651 [Trichonephila clavipes]
MRFSPLILLVLSVWKSKDDTYASLSLLYQDLSRMSLQCRRLPDFEFGLVEDLSSLELSLHALKFLLKIWLYGRLRILFVNLSAHNFLLLSNGMRSHSFSTLMLLDDETTPEMIFEALYWIESIFSFAVGLADAQMGAVYSRMGLTMVVHVFRSVFGFDLKEAP